MKGRVNHEWRRGRQPSECDFILVETSSWLRLGACAWPGMMSPAALYCSSEMNFSYSATESRLASSAGSARLIFTIQAV